MAVDCDLHLGLSVGPGGVKYRHTFLQRVLHCQIGLQVLGDYGLGSRVLFLRQAISQRCDVNRKRDSCSRNLETTASFDAM